MADGKADDGSDVDQFGRLRIELAMDGLVAVDRLRVLNAALENVLHDASGGR